MRTSPVLGASRSWSDLLNDQHRRLVGVVVSDADDAQRPVADCLVALAGDRYQYAVLALRAVAERVTRRRRTGGSLRAQGCGNSKGLSTGGTGMALLIILALLVALFVGLGFVIKWLFILAVVAALIWVIAFFMGRARA